MLDAKQLGRWEELELAQSLQRMPDVVFCPRCSSACLEDAQNCAQCAKCFFAFCSLCNESWHPGIEVCRDPRDSACPEGHPWLRAHRKRFCVAMPALLICHAPGSHLDTEAYSSPWKDWPTKSTKAGDRRG